MLDRRKLQSAHYICASWLLGWLVGWLLGWLVACLLGWLVTRVDAGRIQSQHTLFVCALLACLLGWLVGWLVGCWLVQFSPSARALQDYFRKSLQLVGWSVNWYVHPMLYWPLYYLPASHFVVSVCYSDPVVFFLPSFFSFFLVVRVFYLFFSSSCVFWFSSYFKDTNSNVLSVFFLSFFIKLLSWLAFLCSERLWFLSLHVIVKIWI